MVAPAGGGGPSFLDWPVRREAWRQASGPVCSVPKEPSVFAAKQKQNEPRGPAIPADAESKLRAIDDRDRTSLQLRNRTTEICESHDKFTLTPGPLPKEREADRRSKSPRWGLSTTFTSDGFSDPHLSDLSARNPVNPVKKQADFPRLAKQVCSSDV